jgi:hypothetical protein
MLPVRRQKTETVACCLRELTYERDAQREQRVEINHRKVLLVSGQVARIQDVKKWSPAFADFLPGILPTEDRMLP